MLSWHWSGKTFKPRKSIPITDRGFRYGMSVFETLKVWDGRVQFLDEHLGRLRTACGLRDFPINEPAFESAGAFLAAARINGMARIYITAGDGAPADPVIKPRIFLYIQEREAEKADSYGVIIHDDPYRAPFDGLKTANYWFNADTLALTYARKEEEALLFNDLGELVSGCMSNVFLVRDDKIFTPNRGTGCRMGVVREWVIKRRKVEERRLRREDVLKADEIFLTSSWLGIMPVATVEGRPLGRRFIGPQLVGDFERRWSE